MVRVVEVVVGEKCAYGHCGKVIPEGSRAFSQGDFNFYCARRCAEEAVFHEKRAINVSEVMIEYIPRN